jgi:hypothetical protein
MADQGGRSARGGVAPGLPRCSSAHGDTPGAILKPPRSSGPAGPSKGDGVLVRGAVVGPGGPGDCSARRALLPDAGMPVARGGGSATLRCQSCVLPQGGLSLLARKPMVPKLGSVKATDSSPTKSAAGYSDFDSPRHTLDTAWTLSQHSTDDRDDACSEIGTEAQDGDSVQVRRARGGRDCGTCHGARSCCHHVAQSPMN